MKDALCTGSLALVDPDEKKLKWMADIARRAIEHRGVPLKLELAAHHRKVLKGADFVILGIHVRACNLHPARRFTAESEGAAPEKSAGR